MTSMKRVLPPDVYDALEFSALAFGGIGAGSWGEPDYPVCSIGHLVAAEVPGVNLMSRPPVVPVSEDENDDAVRRINRRKKKSGTSRVTFSEWCRELGIVRGASTENTK